MATKNFIRIGQPVNNSERRAIRILREQLPGDDWWIFNNFEMRSGEQVFEIDIAILAPHAVYLVDVKGVQGNIEVRDSPWYREEQYLFPSPLPKLRHLAGIMHTAIQESNTNQPDLGKVHVQATVLLTANGANVSDPRGIDCPDVTHLNDCAKYFKDTNCVPDRRLDNIKRFYSQIITEIRGKPKPKVQQFRDWQVKEELDGIDRYTEYREYRAKHNLLGVNGGMTRLQLYQVNPYQDKAAREKEIEKISNAYRAVAHMPPHANVLVVKELFLTDDEDEVVLVTEDLPGSQTLRQHINKESRTLTFDQKLRVMRDVLEALEHVHQYGVIHRNLTPDAILVTEGGQVRVTGFNFARVGSTTTSADQVVGNLEAAYQAPECSNDPTQASIASDLFAAGVTFYELLTGKLPFESTEQRMEADGNLMKPSEHKSNLPTWIDEWLPKFYELAPQDRYTCAAIVRKVLDDQLNAQGQERAFEQTTLAEDIATPEGSEDNLGAADNAIVDMGEKTEAVGAQETIGMQDVLGTTGIGTQDRQWEKQISFAVSENDEFQDDDTRRYLPPDYDYSSDMKASDWMDRVLYALGISFYESLTGNYPFDTPTPPSKTQPKDPRQPQSGAG